MFESIIKFFKKFSKEDKTKNHSKDAAKERLHLVLMQDRANVSADFLDLMKQEIIEVIKKYIDVDESEIDVRLANKTNEDGTTGAPALYANIPIISIKEGAKKGVGASIARPEKDKQDDNKDDVGASIAHPEKEKQDDNKDGVGASIARPEKEKQDDNKDGVGASIARPEKEKQDDNQDGVGASIAHPEKEKQDDNKDSVGASIARSEKDKQDDKKETKI